MLIAHSLGGLVAKGIYNRFRQPGGPDRSLASAITAMIFMGVPSQGVINRIPEEVALRLFAGSIGADLRSREQNSWIDALDSTWHLNLTDAKSRSGQTDAMRRVPLVFCVTETLRTPFDVLGFKFAPLLLVPMSAAEAKCDRPPFPAKRDHFSLVKPVGRDDVYDEVRARLYDARKAYRNNCNAHCRELFEVKKRSLEKGCRSLMCEERQGELRELLHKLHDRQAEVERKKKELEELQKAHEDSKRALEVSRKDAAALAEKQRAIDELSTQHEAAKKELETLKKQLPDSPPQPPPQETAADEERVSQAQEERLALVLEVKQLLVDRTLFLDRRYAAERPGGKEQHEVGEGTKWYIRRYQSLHGLSQTGEVTVELRDHLKANCGTRFIKKRWQKWGCSPSERARNVAAQTKAARTAKAEAKKRREHRLAQKREPAKPAPVQVAVSAAGQRTKISVLPARTSLVNAVRLQGVTIDPTANHRSTVTIIPDESRLPICPAQTCTGSIPASVELAFSPSIGASNASYRLRVQLACVGTSTDAASTTASNCHIDPTSVGDVVETLSTKIHGFAVEAGTRRR